jgi:hypothetical protein
MFYLPLVAVASLSRRRQSRPDHAGGLASGEHHDSHGNSDELLHGDVF